jgi:hypothetical protein
MVMASIAWLAIRRIDQWQGANALAALAASLAKA